MPGGPKPGSFPGVPFRAMKARAPIAVASTVMGAACWWLGIAVGTGPTALHAGWAYLLILAVAGFVLGIVERDMSWTALAGLYAGQLAGLLAQAAAGVALGLPLGWHPLFIVSVTLSAAVGGALGSIAGRRLGAGAARP